MFLTRRPPATPKIEAANWSLAADAPKEDETSNPAEQLVAEEPAPSETPRGVPRPLWQLELSAARNYVDDESEAKAGEQNSAAKNTEIDAPAKPVTVTDDELRAPSKHALPLS